MGRRAWGRGRGARVIRVPWGQLSGSHVPGALCNGPHTLQWTPHFAMDPTLSFVPASSFPPPLYPTVSPSPLSSQATGRLVWHPQGALQGAAGRLLHHGARQLCYSTPPCPALPPHPASSRPAPLDLFIMVRGCCITPPCPTPSCPAPPCPHLASSRPTPPFTIPPRLHAFVTSMSPPDPGWGRVHQPQPCMLGPSLPLPQPVGDVGSQGSPFPLGLPSPSLSSPTSLSSPPR